MPAIAPVNGFPRPIFCTSFVLGVALLILPWIVRAGIASRATDIRFELSTQSIDSDGGFAWHTPLSLAPQFGRIAAMLYELPTDHGSNTRSALRLFEDGVELGPSRAVHLDVRELGGGRFSHWRRDLYFTTSDNSDPRSNQRRYRVESPIEVSSGVDLVSLLLSLIGAIILFSCPPIVDRTASWRARWLVGGHASHVPMAARWQAVPISPTWRMILILVWIASATTAVWIGRGEHDPYLLSTVPTTGYSDHSNALVGYAAMIDGTPRHAENMQTWDHVAMFNGSFIAADMYANRPLFPFFVSCLAWLVGITSACLLTNLIAWAIGTWAAVRVGAELALRPEAGVIAGLLACLGQGWWFHLGDYSAHLLSFTMSAVCLLVLLRSQIWVRRQPAEVHASVGATLVLAGLAYNSALFFVAAYLLLALRHNRWIHILLVVVASVFVQRLWPPLLNLLSSGNFDYYAVERGLLQNALKGWEGIWQSGTMLDNIGRVLVDTLVPIAPILPLLVYGALAPLLRGVQRSIAPPGGGAVLLMFLAIALPMIAVIVYSPTATARGYLVFGGATAVWALAGTMTTRLRAGAWRGIGMGLLLLALIGQAYLVTRHADGDARAVKLFMWGQPDWNVEQLQSWREMPRTTVVGLAGEPAPRVAGGALPLAECGGYTGGEAQPTLPAFKNALQLANMLIVRAVPLLSIGMFLHLGLLAGLIRIPSRAPSNQGVTPTARMTLAIGLVAALLLPPVAARFHRGGTVMHRHMIVDRRLPHRGTELVQEIRVAPSSVAMLEALLASSREPESSGALGEDLIADCLTGFGWSASEGEGVEVAIMAGSALVTSFNTELGGRLRRPIDFEALVAGLRNDPMLRITARRKDGIAAVASWQRGDVPGRSLMIDGQALPPAPETPTPIFELRVHPRERNFTPVLLLY